jgi:hypothetical protein
LFRRCVAPARCWVAEYSLVLIAHTDERIIS